MILGNLQYPSRYGGLGSGVLKGLNFLAENDLNAIPVGKYFIDEKNVFFEVSEITSASADSKLFEAHRNYIDIQITLSGEEWYGHAIVSLLKEVKPYLPEQDIAYYSGEGVYLQTPPGHFILFMPEDAHKPGVFFKNQGLIKKLVMKVKI